MFPGQDEVQSQLLLKLLKPFGAFVMTIKIVSFCISLPVVILLKLKCSQHICNLITGGVTALLPVNNAHQLCFIVIQVDALLLVLPLQTLQPAP